MILEHSFVTTRGEHGVLQDARDALLSLGYAPEPEQPPSSVCSRRGSTKASRAKDITRLPQRVRIGFDRGLVTVAASLEVYGKEKDTHRQLLLALATLMEAHLGRGQPLAPIRSDWDRMHDDIQRRARRKHRITLAIALIIVGAIVGTVALIVADTAGAGF